MDNATLRDLVQKVREGEEPRFASVYYDNSHDTEDAVKVVELTWREARDDLAGQGADEPTLRALDEAVQAMPPPVGRGGHALIAAHGEVLLASELATPPVRPVARWSALPYVLPLVARGHPHVAHLVVRADRVGAQITGVNRDGAVAERRAIHGNPDVHEPRPFGTPPQRHVHEHVRERVRQNLTHIAGAVTEVADKVHAELVVLAGETKGRSALRELLPEQVKRRTVEVGQSRTDGSDGELDEKLPEFIAGRQDERLNAVLERFTAEIGKPDGLAVQGIDATCAALREAKVDTLVIGDDGEQTVFAGGDPIEIAVEPDHLYDLGIEPAHQRRADEALPIAALAVGADLLYTGERLDLQDAFGALLRYR